MKKKTAKKKVSLNSKVSKGVSPERVRTVDDILGVRQFNPFGTNDLAQLESKLSTMNLADMHELAVKVELLPHHDKGIMKSRIIKAFKVFKGSRLSDKNIRNIKNEEGVDLKTKRGQEIQKILNRGR